MNERRRFRAPLLAFALCMIAASLPVAASAAPSACAGGVTVDAVSLPVQGEVATGRVYQPYRCRPGDLAPRDLIVFAHGHTATSAEAAPEMAALAKQTSAPLLSMDHRSATSTWKTGEWNIWAGWQDTVAATLWYKKSHPQVTRTVLWGGSQGGATSGLALAYGPPGLYDYWVDTFGVSNLFVMWAGASVLEPATAAEMTRDAGGCTPVQCPDAYRARSTARLAGRMHVKHVVLLHGLSDTTVPYEQSIELRDALTGAGKPSSLYTIATGRDTSGRIVLAGHGHGPVTAESACVVARILTGKEPLAPAGYTIDALTGVNTAPKAPAGMRCAA